MKHLDSTVRRAAIPDGISSDVEHDRLHHLDLPHLSELEIWAESVVITNVLSRLVFEGRPERVAAILPGGFQPVTDREWLTDRLSRLKREQRRRGRAA